MIENAYVKVEEGQLHLRQLTSHSTALPLVLLHASPASSRTLMGLMEELGNDRSIYAFDTPGNGQSSRPVGPNPSIKDLADMLSRGIDALGLTQFAVYGTHTGAHIATEIALALSGRVTSVILDGVLLIDDATRSEYLEFYAVPKYPDEMGSQFQWAWNFIRDQMLFYPHYKKSDEHRRRGGTFDVTILHQLTLDVLNNLDTYHLPYKAVFLHNVRESLQHLGAPTLVLTDDVGPLSLNTSELKELLVNPHVVQGCSSEAIKADAIKNFLGRLPNG